jgi:hypothetical protein
MFGSFWTLDTTPMTNIEDKSLMIMAGMCTNRKSCPYGRAFLPSEGEWVFDFSMVVALPLLYGNNVIRNIQQFTTDGDRHIYNPLDLLSQNESSPWYGVKHMLCTFHLVEQQFDNDVLNKEDREGVFYQVKNWIHSFKNYCKSEDKYKLSYKLLIEFMNRLDVFESMGPAYPYILDKYLLSTWIKKKDKLLFSKRMFLRNLNNCTSIPSEVENSSIKQGDDRVRPTMSILTAAHVMTDKSNHRMLVKEGKSAKSTPSTKLWSKSKTSNKITSHGEGLVETEYYLRNNYCSVQASAKVWWVMPCLTFKNWRKISGYMGHHAFAGLGLSHLVPKEDCCVIVGIYTGLKNHVVTDIISQASLKAQIVKLCGGTVFIIILERILNIQERQPASSAARNLESPMHPTSKSYQACIQ